MRRQIAGCFYCLKVFKLTSVTKYTADGEMLCPFCGVDAVLDGVSCGAVLKRQHARKFEKITPLYPKTQYGDK